MRTWAWAWTHTLNFTSLQPNTKYWLINFPVTQWIWFALLIFIIHVYCCCCCYVRGYLLRLFSSHILTMSFLLDHLTLISESMDLKKNSGTILFIPKSMNFIFISNENQFPYFLEWHHFNQAIDIIIIMNKFMMTRGDGDSNKCIH